MKNFLFVLGVFLILNSVSFSGAEKLHNSEEAAVMSFLKANSLQEKSNIAVAHIKSTIQMKNDNIADKDIKRKLSEQTSYFLGVSGTNAPVIASAITKAVDTNYIKTVIASISVVASSIPETISGKDVANIIKLRPEGERKVLTEVAATPQDYLDRNAYLSIPGNIRRMRLLLINWDEKTGKVKKDFLKLD